MLIFVFSFIAWVPFVEKHERELELNNESRRKPERLKREARHQPSDLFHGVTGQKEIRIVWF